MGNDECFSGDLELNPANHEVGRSVANSGRYVSSRYDDMSMIF